MATFERQLATAPESERDYELWLQHAAGKIIFEDARAYAAERIPADASPEARKVALSAIDDALYGIMMIAEGVSGRLENSTDQVHLALFVRHLRFDRSGDQHLVSEFDLAMGDGLCMGFHGWVEGDFGRAPVLVPEEATTT